ncbi:MAG: FecR family protein [bacterium]|nr:FecR family protein [bacterium]
MSPKTQFSCLTGVIIIALIFPTVSLAGSIPTCGQVRFVGGPGVEFMPRGGAFWTTLKIYQKLHHGEAVRTATGSRAELALGGGITIRMDEMSVLEITPSTKEMTDTVSRIRVLRGVVWFMAEPLPKGETFVVETPEAAVGLRGTVFIVSRHDDQGTLVEVHEGAVAVWNRARRKSNLLREGHEAVCPTGGQTTTIRPVPTGIRAVKWSGDVWYAGDPLLTRDAEEKWLLENKDKGLSPRRDMSSYGLLKSDFHYAPGLPGVGAGTVEERMQRIQEDFEFLEDEARELEDRFDGFIEDTDDSLRDVDLSE